MADSEPGLICIAGLGNPGAKYQFTPHNLGFLVVDELARRHRIDVGKSESRALIGTGQIAGKPVLLVKPKTFMNLSGEAIGPILQYRKLSGDDLILVHDELDLKFGALRIRKGGSPAGHNGVKSVISVLKTPVFTRIRVGIGLDLQVDAVEYVLAPFAGGMQAEVDSLVSYTADAVESMVAEGADKTMAKFNRRAPGSKTEEEA